MYCSYSRKDLYHRSLRKSLTVPMMVVLVLVTNQLNAKNLVFCFIISLLYASTCFENYVLIIRRSKLCYTAYGIITPVGGRPVHRLREDSLLSQPVHGTATYRCDDTRCCITHF